MMLAALKSRAGVGPRKHNIVQGEHYVTDDENLILTTVLGSCVAACLFDPMSMVGGMNHFLLAEAKNDDDAAMRYGAFAMEVLINDLLKFGASRDRLQAKVFGGAKIAAGYADIGRENALFIRRFLADEGIPIISQSLGGTNARRIEFTPVGGRVRMRETDPATVRLVDPPQLTKVGHGEVELF